MHFRYSLLVSTALVTLASPALAQQANAPSSPPLPPLPQIALPDGAPPLPPLPSPDKAIEPAPVTARVPAIPEPMAAVPPLPDAPKIPAPAPSTAMVPPPPPTPPAPPGLPKLPELKTIGEVPPAKPVASSGGGGASDGWLNKIKTMVGMGDEKKLPAPAPQKDIVKTIPAPVPPGGKASEAAGAPALPPPPPLKLDDLKAADASTPGTSGLPPLPPVDKTASPALPPLPAPEKMAAPALPPLPSADKASTPALPAIPAPEEKMAAPALPPLPSAEKPTAPSLPPLPAADKLAAPALPAIPEPDKTAAPALPTPPMPDLKLPEPPAQASAPALPPLPESDDAVKGAVLPNETKTADAPPPLPELALPGQEGKSPPPLPPLPPVAEKNETKPIESTANKDDELPIEEDKSVDPGVFEFGALNNEGKPTAAPKKPVVRASVSGTASDGVSDADIATPGFPGHDYKTQVLPSIINRKEYETRNAHLPKAVFREDMEGLLFIAAGRGDLNAMRALLNEGTDIESKNAIGDTPLVHAAINGQAGAVRVLLARGANPNNPNVHGLTAMQVAAQRGREDIIEALFEMGAKSNADYRDPHTPLKSGVGRGYASIYNAMLDGENPRIKEQEQRNRALSALAEAGPAPRLVISAGRGESQEIRDPRLKKAPGAPLTFDEIEKGLMYQEYKRKTGDDPAVKTMADTSIPKMISPAGSTASPVPIPYPAKPQMMAVPQQPREGMQLPPQPYGRMVPKSDIPIMQAPAPGPAGGMENPSMVSPSNNAARSGYMPPQPPMPDAPLGKDGLPDLPGGNVQPLAEAPETTPPVQGRIMPNEVK